jgi:hypothetical protein
MCTSSTVCRSGIDGRRRCCSKAGPQLENEIDSQPSYPRRPARESP